MSTYHTRFLFLIVCCIILFSACSGEVFHAHTGTTGMPSTATTPSLRKTVTPAPAYPSSTAHVSPTPQPTVVATSTPTAAPTRYTAHTVLRSFGRPDDLVFDPQGRLVFSDFYNGTISRINTNGSATTFLHGLAGPEGLVYLPDGTLVIAEQRTNRILALSHGEFSPHLLRTLPGMPSAASCKDGVDGIAFDATNNTLIIPDSPAGNVYRMSETGRSLSLIASGITRPVGAAVDAHGTIYIADECGGALWKLTPNGTLTRTGNFGMLDDVVLDRRGNLLVTDLAPAIHAVIRVNPATGARITIASRGFIEPQGLLVDSHDNVYVSDDYANVIVEYTPV